MGDVTELMVEGYLCQNCGVLIDGDDPGHPRDCEDCKTDDWRE